MSSIGSEYSVWLPVYWDIKIFTSLDAYGAAVNQICTQRSHVYTHHATLFNFPIFIYFHLYPFTPIKTHLSPSATFVAHPKACWGYDVVQERRSRRLVCACLPLEPIRTWRADVTDPI